MRKTILLSILLCCSVFAARGQFTAYISGQINNMTGGSGGVQKVSYRWQAKVFTVAVDSGQGFFMSNSSGVVSGNVNISLSDSVSVFFTFTMKNCDSLTVTKTDSCSAAAPNVSFTMKNCGEAKINLGGSMQDHWKNPVPLAKIYVKYDSAGISSTQRLDTITADSLGVFVKSYNVPRTWNNGKLTINYGCYGEMNTSFMNYQLYADQNGDRAANVNFWYINYCRLKGPRAVFSGYIRDSSNNPVPNLSFIIRADSVFNADSMVINVKTDINGYYADSMSVDSTKAFQGWKYRIQTCGQTQFYQGQTPLLNKIARTQYNITNCGLSEWQVYINWYGLVADANDSNDVVIIIADTLGNPIDSFVKRIVGGAVGGIRTIPYAYPHIDIYVRYPTCNGWQLTQKLRASRSSDEVWNFDDYPYCPDVNIRTKLMYQNDTLKLFTGRLYLIRAHKQQNGSVIDTILTAVDSLTLSSQKTGVFNQVTGGTYYIKFAPGTSDPQYSQLLPTYMGLTDSPIYWRNATPLTGTQKDSTYERVIRVRTGTNQGGPGFIGGSLSSGANKKTNPIAGIDIILFDASMRPVRFISSDGNGSFGFSGVALGTWYILVDVPGRTATLRKVELTSTTQSLTDINFKVHKKYVENVDATGLSEMMTHEMKLYPNPAHTEVNLELENGVYDLCVLDINGRELISLSFQGTICRVDLAGLKPGVYFIRTNEKSKGSFDIRKLIVE